ncbi:hypothetical protein E3E12_05725 [Formicincola oecophyllae]|uniref:Uncharacterized protein n=1 Tax=Formicincola oecophyllae TaxID=2558361 RepID=A0A4Y6UB15_9PROT|nr:hypothetical protein [Formicincola oecophyllae]QDH13768.1 hypothetical protein E3E12_05725 [Formicincola oecophyllae]
MSTHDASNDTIDTLPPEKLPQAVKFVVWDGPQLERETVRKLRARLLARQDADHAELQRAVRMCESFLEGQSRPE